MGGPAAHSHDGKPCVWCSQGIGGAAAPERVQPARAAKAAVEADGSAAKTKRSRKYRLPLRNSTNHSSTKTAKTDKKTSKTTKSAKTAKPKRPEAPGLERICRDPSKLEILSPAPPPPLRRFVCGYIDALGCERPPPVKDIEEYYEQEVTRTTMLMFEDLTSSKQFHDIAANRRK
eukprot:m.8667 g.8667  ORF g.8667 m.8667 type:complete len:175 (+) comp2883_c0_seq1:76-600(+)